MKSCNFVLSRYPIVERAVADVRMLSDQSFTSGIRNSVQKILQEDRAKGAKSPKGLDFIRVLRTVDSNSNKQVLQVTRN
jgi:hypothetical protein